MIFSKRRRKTLITVIAIVLLGAVWGVQRLRDTTTEYSAGEQPDGIGDVLARDVPEDYPRIRFENVAQEAGMRFRHFPAKRSNRLPEDMGSGVALGDVNGDGWTDVFLVNLAHALDQPVPTDGSGRSRLFLGSAAGRFTDVTESSGIDLSVLGNGAAFCDVDSDGDLDLFVASYGFCYLFSNDGLGHFEDISEKAGLKQYEGFWASVSVADYDRDGAIDIYVGGYVIYDEVAVSSGSSSSQYDRVIPALINPSTFEPERNLLFHGKGDGTFDEVAGDLGVADPSGRSLGALFTDINGDGWDDLYVANDVSDNALFLGSAEGTFTDVTTEALVGDYRGAMGLAAADFDRDLDVDIFVTHWVGQENALYEQGPRALENADGAGAPFFSDRAAPSGLGASALDKVGWATRFFDYNNDGWLDLFVVNGHTIPMRNDPDRMRPMRTQLFWHERSRRSFFHGVGAVSGEFFRQEHVGRGGAAFDYDLDGDSDLVVVVHGGDAALLRNDGGNAKPALLIRLRQPQGNRFALGARVRIKTASMEAQGTVGSQGSYLSQHAVGEVAFGLGEDGWVEQIEVVWPDGTTATAGPLLANSIIDWEKGTQPKVRSFPGRATLDTDGPISVDDQKSFYALREKALQFRLAGDWNKAVLGYTAALRLWPGHDDCLYYLGNSLIELQSDAPALAVLERLVHFEPQSNQGWMQIGFLRLPGGDPDLDNLDEAQAAFERCHKLNSEETKPVQMLGVVAMLKGDLTIAAKHLADAARLNPRSIPARWFGGRVAWLAGDKTEAQTLLTEAHSLATSNATSDSVSSEGDTASGAAMTAEGGTRLTPVLKRWRSMAQRSGGIDEEYGAH